MQTQLESVTGFEKCQYGARERGKSYRFIFAMQIFIFGWSMGMEEMILGRDKKSIKDWTKLHKGTLHLMARKDKKNQQMRWKETGGN